MTVRVSVDEIVVVLTSVTLDVRGSTDSVVTGNSRRAIPTEQTIIAKGIRREWPKAETRLNLFLPSNFPPTLLCAPRS